MSSKVVTPSVRLSYVNVFEPKGFGDDESNPKYQVTLLIPKSETALIEKIKKAIVTAAEEGKDTKFKGKIPNPLPHTFKDGDEMDEPKEGYEGHMYLRCSSTTKPGIVDSAGVTITEANREQVYSGMFARASIKAAAYNYGGKKGITFYLNNIMKTADGPSLGGSSRAEEDFADFINESDPESPDAGSSIDIDLL